MTFEYENDKERVERNSNKSFVYAKLRQDCREICRKRGRQDNRTRVLESKGLSNIIQNIKDTNNLIDLIYAIEPLAYYFDMKPSEFWNSRYSEINIYCQTHLVKIFDDLRREIDLQEAVTNKLIAGDCMNQNAKIIMIRDNYKELFEDKQEQTLEEQRKLFKG